MTPEDRDAYLEQCWKDVTVEKDTDTWSKMSACTFNVFQICKFQKCFFEVKHLELASSDQVIMPFLFACTWHHLFDRRTRTSEEIKWDSNSKSIARLLPNETETLKQIIDPAQTLWVWITSLLSRLAADGEIPPIPTPTYGRVITMAEQAYTGIRAVRASIRVQPPYVHVQMMAALVLVS